MKFFIVFCLCALFAGCGGNSGSSSLPSPIPYGTVKGVAHDNILVGSTITVYQYTGGAKGAALGSATTNNDGNYSLSIQCETAPLLIEATGGYYIEEASLAQVNLKTGQVLRAVVNFKTKDDISTQLTPYTHIAAGLAEYRIRQGADAGNAIDSANQDVSSLLGFDIIKTKPVDVTNPLNATVYVSNEHLYGFLSAAISDWTLYSSKKVEPLTPHANFNSIALAQLMYKDISADGILDGKGLDDTLQVVSLAFGILPLNANVYRHALAAHMVQFADQSENNHTNLKGAALEGFAAAYAGNSGVIFGNTSSISFANDGRAVISGLTVSYSTGISDLMTGSFVGHKRTVCASVSGVGDLDTAALPFYSSNPTPVNYLTPTSPCWDLDATDATDGDQPLTFNVMDTFGISSSLTITVKVNNTAPTLSVNTQSNQLYPSNITTIGIGGPFSDAGSDVSSVTMDGSNTSLAFTNSSSGTWSFDLPIYGICLAQWKTRNLVIRNSADNCSVYSFSTECDIFRSVSGVYHIRSNVSGASLVSSGSCT